MIRIIKAEEGRRCLCCLSEDNVREIHFESQKGNRTHSTVITLCRDCITELKEGLASGED